MPLIVRVHFGVFAVQIVLGDLEPWIRVAIGPHLGKIDALSLAGTSPHKIAILGINDWRVGHSSTVAGRQDRRHNHAGVRHPFAAPERIEHVVEAATGVVDIDGPVGVVGAEVDDDDVRLIA